MQICRSALWLVATIAFIVTTTTTFAASNILYILDASNSMWGRVDGVPKIEVAKNVLSDLLKKTPGNINVGLITYGHRFKDECDDMELIAPIGANNVTGIIGTLKTITPRGKTPIAGALSMSLKTLQNRLEENNTVVVISDGVETCGGDACAAAKALASAGVNTRVHVVGFDIEADERRQLQCISENGKGQYFSASNAAELTTAIAQVQKIAQAAPKPEATPEPEPKPKLVKFFRDDFDGEDLGEHWEIINPDPDNYIVENGELLVISSTVGSFAKENIANIFRLDKELPKGDWNATIKFSEEFQTGAEAVFFGLYDNKKNYLITRIWPQRNPNSGRWALMAARTKVSKGNKTDSQTRVWYSPRGSKKKFTSLMASFQPILLRFGQQGRSYTSAIKLSGTAKPKWIDLPELKLLRRKGNLAFGVMQWKKREGETTLTVDQIKIETQQ